jgi:hypothetical protein
VVVGFELARGVGLLEDPEEKEEEDGAKQDLGKSRSTIADLHYKGDNEAMVSTPQDPKMFYRLGVRLNTSQPSIAYLEGRVALEHGP